MSGLASVISVFTAAGRGLELDSRRTKADRASEPIDLAVTLLEVEKLQSESALVVTVLKLFPHYTKTE
ncbi:MAG: hypothetical protein ACI8XU_002470 [Kiritimatiellia bacterium]|jgi:hypothetical protein